MPKIYKRHCDICGLYYEGVSKKCCSLKCAGILRIGNTSHKVKLSDGTYYPKIPSICECDDITCNRIVYDGNKYIHGHNSIGINSPSYGKEPWCKGLTSETNEIIKLKSEKTSKSLMGIKMTEERRIKHAEERRKHPSMLGKHHKESTKNLQRKAKLGKLNHRYGKPSPDGAGHCKRYYYESEFHGIICFKGSYEYKYALYLDKNNISWLYQPKTFELSECMTYTPDFYLPEQDLYIEIKGFLYPIHKVKIEKFQKEYPDLKLDILYKEDLSKLGIDMKIELDQNLHLKGKQKLQNKSE